MAKALDPPRPATYADLEQLPVYRVGEIVDGQLYGSPRPAIATLWRQPSLVRRC